jgi:hypothetical protein
VWRRLSGWCVWVARRRIRWKVCGGAIDIAVNQTGYVDCLDVVIQYLIIADAPVFEVPPELAGAYQLYRSRRHALVERSLRPHRLECSLGTTTTPMRNPHTLPDTFSGA